MATERTAMTPDGDVIFFEVADEQYITQEGAVVDAGLSAAASSGVVHSLAGEGGLAGPGGIAGPKGGLAN